MELLTQLRQLSNQFSTEAEQQKNYLLQQLAGINFTTPKELMTYHEILLFMAAYPQSSTLHKTTRAELKRIAQFATAIQNGNNTAKAEQLVRTGIAGTATRANFSLTLCRHLLQVHGDAVQLYSCEGDEVWSKEILRCTLPLAESEQLNDSSVTLESWLLQYKKNTGKNALALLIALLDSVAVSAAIKEQLFDALKIFVSITLNDAVPSRTNLSILNTPVFYHKKELSKKVDALQLIKEPLTEKVALTKAEKEKLVSAARASLFLLNRETDTITYTNINTIEQYNTSKGISIVLFELEPNRRLAFETYAGYMAFKNGIPVAYGGAWPFGHTAKIGLNIYEPFRGGESAHLFCQLMRVYHHRFGVKEFTVEPYQMGHGNKEGLLSGAFWFYYRMGFRPVEEKIAHLAAEEQQKITTQKGYRTPLNTMKKLVAGNAALIIEPFPDNELTQAHLSLLSNKVSEYIDRAYKGDRQKALEKSSALMRLQLNISAQIWKTYSESQQNSFNQLSLLFVQLSNIRQWKDTEKKQLLQWMLNKGGASEYTCPEILQKHAALNTAMIDLLQS